MSNYNLNSGYGRLMAERMGLGNSAGKVFVVGKSAIAYRDLYTDLFTGDPDGRPRFSATLAGAASMCTANGADRIFLLPGHTETISSNTALTLSVAGISVIGLGSGSNRPTITLDTATTATINITAASISFQNVTFVANFAAIVAPFTLTTAKDFALLGCDFRDTSAVLNFVNIVDTNTTTADADGLRIEDCRRIGLGADTNTTIVKMDGTNDRVSIKRNKFSHLAVTDGGLMIIATGKIVTNAEIEDNKCNFLGATGSTGGILITTNGTTNSGYLDGNRVWSLDATTEILVTASSGFKFGLNYYSGTADKSGYLLPAADA